MKLDDELKFFKRVLYSCKTLDQLNSIRNWKENVHWNTGNIFESYHLMVDMHSWIKEMQSYLESKVG